MCSSDLARGQENESAGWPDVVAYGINVLSDWPSHLTKSSLQLQQDQGSAAWRALPSDQQSSHAVMSGTSQATAQVSRAAAQVVYFFQRAILATRDAKPGDPIFTIQIPRQEFNVVSRHGRRLTGDVSRSSKDNVEVTYRYDQPWKVVKQILIDTAIPMPEFSPAEVGAGFVAPDYIDAQFGRFNVGQPQILPIKVIP